MNSTPHDTPTPLEYEGCFWLNCAAAFCRAQPNVEQFRAELKSWQQASADLLGAEVSEAFWGGFTPGMTTPNLSPHSQLEKALAGAAQAAANLANAQCSGFVRVPSLRGADLLLRDKINPRLFIKFTYNNLTTVAQITPMSQRNYNNARRK